MFAADSQVEKYIVTMNEYRYTDLAVSITAFSAVL